MITLKTGAKIKTHEELGISFREWMALFATWGVLANNIIPHDDSGGRTGQHRFDINVGCYDDGHCGTVSCIGGTMALAMGMNANAAARFVDNAAGGLNRLFYPATNKMWSSIEGRHAAEAIWNFLCTGKPRWDKIDDHIDDLPARYEPYKGKVLDHQKLGLSFNEWLALIGVRVMLDCGAIDHARDANGALSAAAFLALHPGAHAFNMGIAAAAAGCGTVACIGGYMGAMMFDRVAAAERYVYQNDPDNNIGEEKLGHLFYPLSGHRRDCAYEDITAAQAVQAIDNFLSTGKPNWEKVLAKG